ncbi:MAG: class I mannose-6-phosphate isomerase [Planctomycetota bacterium]|jgi:mannose-6-phosphate isomerase|nr:class I mannose-6-phosphate isomerase [Planctomycetota bacterium]
MSTLDHSDAPQPQRLAPIFLEKIWGGSRLEAVTGLGTGGRERVGEVWLAADLEGRQSLVNEGSDEGLTLGQLARTRAAQIMGSAALNEAERFPVLVKFLDTDKPLSVQVHPDAATARRLSAGVSGKSEAWYILAAEPDSLIHLGLRPEVDARAFAAGATGADVVDLLNPVPVQAGDFFHVPPGTVHAIGAGITLLEVSDCADITYRLFDWDRLDENGQSRPVHPEEALLSVDYERVTQTDGTVELVSAGSASRRARLVDEAAFAMELLRVGDELDLSAEEAALLYVVLGGAGQLVSAAGEREIVAGECWLLPAQLGTHSLVAGPSELSVMRVETRSAEARP